MKTIWNLMRIDVIAQKRMGLLSLVLSAIAGVILEFNEVYIGVCQGMLLITIFAARNIFDMELNSGCNKMYSILPVSRKSIVYRRFLLMFIMLIAVAVILYIFGLVALSYSPIISEGDGLLTYMMPNLSQNSILLLTFAVILFICFLFLGGILYHLFVYGTVNEESAFLKKKYKQLLVIVTAVIIFAGIGAVSPDFRKACHDMYSSVKESFVSWLNELDNMLSVVSILIIAGLLINVLNAYKTVSE